MKKVFIDCGYHLGEGLNQFTTLLNIDSSWDVYVFEPNPYCCIDKNIIQHPFKVTAYKNAVWTEDTILSFNIQHQNKAFSPTINSHHELDGWGSCISELNSDHEYDKQEQVSAINFSNFLKQFKNCIVFCKMDIEGAEFPVLRKLISDKTVQYIKELWVEWHTVNFVHESKQTEEQLIEQIKQHTKVSFWH